MARFSRSELESFRGRQVPDLIGPDPRLMFVGINPGLWTAAVQTHFAHPGNRFYPALFRAGIITEPIDPSDGMTDQQRADFVGRGLAITNLVTRATVRADELTREELRRGGAELVSLVRRVRPAVVAIAGITAYRGAFGFAKASTGRQTTLPPDWPESTELWVVPNPSGLNAHETIASLADAYAAAAVAAGIIARGPQPPR